MSISDQTYFAIRNILLPIDHCFTQQSFVCWLIGPEQIRINVYYMCILQDELSNVVHTAFDSTLCAINTSILSTQTFSCGGDSWPVWERCLSAWIVPSVWLAQLFKAPSVHVHSSMTVQEVRGSTPRTDSQHSGFLPFEVGKWVTTITNGRWQLFGKMRIYGTEGFETVCVTLLDLMWPVLSTVITGKTWHCY